jgi:radical SAM protein with 4Fe4S-binding SPASM domain
MNMRGISDQYILGNVTDGFTHKALRQEFFVLQTNRLPECLQCDLSKWCCGGCPGNNYKATGSILHPAPHGCREMRYVRAHQELWKQYQDRYLPKEPMQLPGTGDKDVIPGCDT